MTTRHTTVCKSSKLNEQRTAPSHVSCTILGGGRRARYRDLDASIRLKRLSRRRRVISTSAKSTGIVCQLLAAVNISVSCIAAIDILRLHMHSHALAFVTQLIVGGLT